MVGSRGADFTPSLLACPPSASSPQLCCVCLCLSTQVVRRFEIWTAVQMVHKVRDGGPTPDDTLLHSTTD